MANKYSTKETEEQKKRRLEEAKLVRGVFRFTEVPGGTLSFPYRAHLMEPTKDYTFTDGQVYTIPLGVARHLARNVAYPEYEHLAGDSKTMSAFAVENSGTANPTEGLRVKRMVPRCTFESLEFMDLGGDDKKILEVEYVNK